MPWMETCAMSERKAFIAEWRKQQSELRSRRATSDHTEPEAKP